MTDDLAEEVGTRIDLGTPINENAEKIRRIRLDTDQNNPVIKEYIEAVKKGMTMQNEPQLSEEMPKDDLIDRLLYRFFRKRLEKYVAIGYWRGWRKAELTYNHKQKGNHAE